MITHEWGVLRAERCRFAFLLSREVGVVAGVTADRWNDGLIQFGRQVPWSGPALGCPREWRRGVALDWRKRSRSRRIVRQGGLCRPITRDYRRQHAVDTLYNSLLLKDVVAETESVRIKVEVPLGRRVVARGVRRPRHIGEPRRRYTPRRIALVVVRGRVSPESAVIRLRRVADVARAASPGQVRQGIERRINDGLSVRWRWAGGIGPDNGGVEYQSRTGSTGSTWLCHRG